MFELYDYQMDAIRKMKNGCVLCGGVGSGKSRTALGYYFLENGGALLGYVAGDNYLPMGDPPMDLYIITTARKRDTKEWEGELSPFLLSADPEVNLYTNKVVIDSWNNIAKYENVENALFIFDEQRVIGSGAWVKSFLKIAKCDENRHFKNQWIMLSATPGDSWMDYIPLFIANGFYKNRTQFIREHVVYNPRVKFPKVDRYVDTRKLVRLRDSILVDMDFQRETIANHIDIHTDYDAALYRRIIRERWNVWDDCPLTSGGELCYALRRAVNEDPSRGVEVLKLAEKHPCVIIFYNFDYELDILRALPYLDGTEVAEWNGHKHQPIPESDRWVYLVQYAAGCEGWNCVKTDSIIFFSQNYSYRVMEQACGRIDRLNTPFRDLFYYHLKSSASIDLDISRSLNAKKDFVIGRFVNRFNRKENQRL